MRIAYVDIRNFRGISDATIFPKGHTVIIGDNNAGKSTIVEAIDLVLGPDRLNRMPVIDEHDFHNGKYLGEDATCIEIELSVVDLSDEQIARFKGNLEFWDEKTETILPPGKIKQVDGDHILPTLRVKFIGKYNPEEDDFEGDTFFCSPQVENGALSRFGKSDKRECGFLYLRALRTGARALSLERGSLLDIILRIREIRPKMWEGILGQLRETSLTSEDSAGLNDILEGLQGAMKEFVPVDWGTQPHLRVSDLTREHLRKTLTVFMATGTEGYAAPFQHQGTGTINTMVLALLSMIADAKKSVIFAMEEPEIALPPYTQKRIVDSIRTKSSQAIFTSHSPFVLEEFSPEQIILVQRNKGILTSKAVSFPTMIKAKNYHMEFRLRFTEALLAKRVLLTEGTTEALVYSAAARRLNDLAKMKYSSLEELGIAIFNVGSENSIPIFGTYFRDLGKHVFAVFDKQESAKLKLIQEKVDHPYESTYKGCERMLVSEIDPTILESFYDSLVASGWPTHLEKYKEAVEADNSEANIQEAIFRYLKWDKAGSTAVDLISMCTTTTQLPRTIREVVKDIKKQLTPEADKVKNEG